MIEEIICGTVVKVVEKGLNWITSKAEKAARSTRGEPPIIYRSTDIGRAIKARLKDPPSPEEGAPPAR